MKIRTIFPIIGSTVAASTITANVNASEAVEATVRVGRAERLLQALEARMSTMEEKLLTVEREKDALAEKVSALLNGTKGACICVLF